MKLLTNYDVLINDVFYRSEHILSYIERHPEMDEVDEEAISNTIMDALVFCNLIDASKESLDLEQLCIQSDLNHFVFQKNPNIAGIPLWLKEKMRTKCIKASGGIPLSVSYAQPAGATRFCIYDKNTAMSALFQDFSFVKCSYNSLTRKGVRVTNRPFLEVSINGESYLIDALTKRIFKSSWFKERYFMEVESEIKFHDFDSLREEYYNEDMRESNCYADYINITVSMITKSSRNEEILYEIEKSREYFKEAFLEADEIREDMKRLGFLL